MPLSSESLRTYITFYESIQAAIDSIPNTPPPSPVARVKGTLQNGLNTLKALSLQLETRDPGPKDAGDLARLRGMIEALVQDKWVTDAWTKLEVDWHGMKTAEAAGIPIGPLPLTLTATAAMLTLGLLNLAQD